MANQPSNVAVGSNQAADGDASASNTKNTRLTWLMCFVLAVDAIGSMLLMLRIIPFITEYEGTAGGRFVFTESFLDLFVLAMCRIGLALLAFAYSYCKAEVRPQYSFNMYLPNGERKSREELEEEALEQSFVNWLATYVSRPAFLCEIVAFGTSIVCVVKCLCRMDLEVGINRDAEPLHPIYWSAVAFSTIVALCEAAFIDHACKNLGELAHQERQNASPSWLTRVSSSMSIPLLSADGLGGTDTTDEENVGGSSAGAGDGADGDNDADGPPVISDIGADANFQAKLTDLLGLCKPDAPLIFLAFVFLILAAAAQVLIPHYTGKILDLLAAAYANNQNSEESVDHVPGFMSNTVKLIIASILGGIFSGCRGSIFTVVGGNVSARLRLRLMDALLIQDIGFYDITKAGDIMSRLSNDTSLVGDQVTLNINVLLRSVVQAIGILIFMVTLSWQLSILAFISVPVITILSKWYGSFIRSLAKVMQKKLADANAVSEAAISSMRTVRSFDAGPTEFEEFRTIMNRYLALNLKSAIAYSGYATIATSLPQLVTALVIYYGGLMIRTGAISSGDLVSFLLYLQSLSDAFASIGAIFSSLTMAVGAADKVFELMARKPRMKLPSAENSGPSGGHRQGGDTSLVASRRHIGKAPTTCNGRIIIDNVKMSYPARPKRTILNGMSLQIPAGKIVALCGSSGGGKSSILSLIQNIYQQYAGKIMIDDTEIHELSPSWLARHVSIVSQEPTLFARSIKRNIMYGLEGSDAEPTDDEIENVAKLANAHDFISKMPQKYETEVGDRGVQLSGGQKQRIAIARALIRKPKILLLDEATSALDAESEHMVQQSIDHMLQTNRGADGTGTTVVIVAHRLSTIRNADIIYVIKEGRLVEQGNHAALMAKSGGAYNALVRRQMEVQQEAGKAPSKEEGKK
mmetsp:Transcript_2359/g.6212  ORF Transcript_2359/g.6212 Transcript_2359/m.6212 type:complete len:921 (-) Transcript_2359:77-2839(-)|eukprot:CAMPEP_0119573766 /NCGR_PEP_ID=MMETSP1352-20130426/45288_1 /TAXON_ID=265584 /ORGANISM="Stauroneis constricta, Strain CCMP1120" /LENGTH=920 /DNA_ID=CAMNT_0007623457 /DNA_START=47 /DNA_END=2809 /DNA_ORIENTATION=-